MAASAARAVAEKSTFVEDLAVELLPILVEKSTPLEKLAFEP